MNVASESALRVASVLWLRSRGEPALTVVCKATFTLGPGDSPLAPHQDEANEDDEHWDDDPARSLSAASDLAPFKARPEVVLVGHAFAPVGAPARSLLARLTVGTVDKTVEVHADRSWTPGGELRQGPRFTKMRLCYERAAGGTSNPVGMRLDAPDARGVVAVPNLQPPGAVVSRSDDRFAPIGFGPIAPTWPARREKLHRHAATWAPRGWPTRPLPADFDAAYFNIAPPDQQLDEIRSDERITLAGLHPEHPRLVTRLPGVRPRVRVERPGRAAEELRLRADTLWIDTDRGVCTLVWRGALPLAHAAEAGRLVVFAEGVQASSARGEARAAQADGAETVFGVLDAGERPTLPFTDTGGAVDAPPPRAPVGDAALPFAPSGEAKPAAPLPAPAPAYEGMATILISSGTPPPAAPPPAPPPPVAHVPPAAVAPAADYNPWPAAGAVLDRQSIGERLLSAPDPAAAHTVAPPAAARAPVARKVRVDEGAAKRGWKPADAPASGASPVVVAVAGSALAASNAAAAALAPASDEPVAAKTPVLRVVTAPRDVIELVWFDPAFMSRMRRKPGWKEIMTAAKPRPNDDEISADGPPEKRQELRDRREVLALLARGEPTDLRGVDEAIAGAIGEDGGFVPPLVLVAGQLALPFDEVDELKATVAAASPLTAGDVRLQAAVDTAQKLLETPWLNGASELAAGLTRKIEEAFGLGNRAMPARYLEQTTERMLLQQRAYQKRTILGKVCLRAILTLAGATEGVPMYLLESLAQELPAFLRFGVRMVAEARSRVDQYEAQGVALRGVAVGMVVAATARR